MRTWRVRAASLAAVSLAAAAAVAGTLAACGSAPAKSTAVTAVPATPLATSLDTARDSWAVVPMAAKPTFWQVFVRPANSPAWRLAAAAAGWSETQTINVPLQYGSSG